MSALARRFVLAVSTCIAVALPLILLAREGAIEAAMNGARAVLKAVGWVAAPLAVVTVIVAAEAMHQLASWLVSRVRPVAPSFIDPLAESGLILGVLGTLSGNLASFQSGSLDPTVLLPGIAVALRSSLWGFGLALCCVWLKHRGPHA